MSADMAPLRIEQVESELFEIEPELKIRFRKKFEGLYDFATENPGFYLGIAITGKLASHPELLGKVERFIGPKTMQMVYRDMLQFQQSRTTKLM